MCGITTKTDQLKTFAYFVLRVGFSHNLPLLS